MAVLTYGRWPVREGLEPFQCLSAFSHLPRRKSQEAAARNEEQTSRDGGAPRAHADCTGMAGLGALVDPEVAERARASHIERHHGWEGADHCLGEVICSR